MTQDAPLFKFAIRKDLDDSFLPTRGEPKATGWDVRAALNSEKLVIRPGEHVKIPLGFRVFAPDGWWLELRPRSSTFAKKALHALYGVIDGTFEGQCIFACQYIPDIRSLGNDLTVKHGDAIGQIIPVKLQEMLVQKISNEEYYDLTTERQSKRGTGGFGSTDDK